MLKIRTAVTSDAKSIANVHINSWRTIYRELIPDSVLENLSLEKREQEWQAWLASGTRAWVAEMDDNVIGFVSICPSRDEDADPQSVAEISAIYLLPEYWRKGIGKQLCQVVFDEIRINGFKTITLWVLEANTIAINFYESMGFNPTNDVAIDHIGCQNLQVIRYKKILSSNYLFSTERLGFKLLEPQDISYLASLESDPIVKKFFPSRGKNKAETAIMISRFINNYKTKGLPYFLLFDKQNNEFIGRAGFGPFEANEVEVGYVLHQKYWGKGLATETLAILIHWAKEHINADYLIALTPIDHLASQRVMEKCGMQYYKNELHKGEECKFYRIKLK